MIGLGLAVAYIVIAGAWGGFAQRHHLEVPGLFGMMWPLTLPLALAAFSLEASFKAGRAMYRLGSRTTTQKALPEATASYKQNRS